MSLFGYDPRQLYRGRGAYESMGAGLFMQPGDIAFKCNFATLDPETKIVLHRRADRRFDQEGPILCAALDNLQVPGYPEHTISVKYATEHRCGVVVRGPGLTDTISGTDPLKDNLPLQTPLPLDPVSTEAIHTAKVITAVDELIRSVLEHHPLNEERRKEGKYPANVVLLRGCGCRLALTPFSELHSMHACIASPTKIIAGLGMCAEMDVLDVSGTTGDYRTLFHRKAEAVAEALCGSGKNYEFSFLHVKAVDDAGHDRAVDLKVGYLEVVDTMVGQLLRLLWQAEKINLTRHEEDRNDVEEQQNYTIIVTGDHSTPVEFGDHSNEPVPFAIAHVCHAVRALGGDMAVEKIKLGPIPHPKSDQKEIEDNEGEGTRGPDNLGNGKSAIFDANASNGKTNGFTSNTSLLMNGGGSSSGTMATSNKFHYGDSVLKFTEFDAAEGALGRFPGSQVMNVVKHYAGVV
jgi:2,3-diphosphopglycerate-independent phosphoglycerate mutase